MSVLLSRRPALGVTQRPLREGAPAAAVETGGLPPRLREAATRFRRRRRHVPARRAAAGEGDGGGAPRIVAFGFPLWCAHVSLVRGKRAAAPGRGPVCPLRRRGHVWGRTDVVRKTSHRHVLCGRSGILGSDSGLSGVPGRPPWRYLDSSEGRIRGSSPSAAHASPTSNPRARDPHGLLWLWVASPTSCRAREAVRRPARTVAE